MKNILLTTLFLFFQVYFYSQELAFGSNNGVNSDLEFNSDNSILSTPYSLVKPWPDCTEPAGLQAIKLSDGNIQLLWDSAKAATDQYTYEIKYQSSRLRAEVNESITTNSYLIAARDIDIDFDFYVRRVCMINGENVESEWVKIKIKKIVNPISQLEDDPCYELKYNINFEEEGNSTNTFRMWFGPFVNKFVLDISYEEKIIYGNIPKGGQYKYKYVTKTIHRTIYPGEKEYIDLPKYVAIVKVHHVIATLNNEDYNCKDFVIVIDKSNCKNKAFYFSEEVNGQSSIQLYIQSITQLDSVKIKLDNGNMYTIPLILDHTSTSGIFTYLGEITTCNDFSIIFPNQNCPPLAINNECNDPLPNADCSDFHFETKPSSKYIIIPTTYYQNGILMTRKDTLYKGLINWNFPIKLEQSYVYDKNGQIIRNFKGKQGQILLEQGKYNFKYYFKDKYGVLQECSIALDLFFSGGSSEGGNNNEDNFCKLGECLSDNLEVFYEEPPFYNINVDNSIDVYWNGPNSSEMINISTSSGIIIGYYKYKILYTLNKSNWQTIEVNSIDGHTTLNASGFFSPDISDISYANFKIQVIPVFYPISGQSPCECNWSEAMVNKVDTEGPKDESIECSYELCNDAELDEWNFSDPVMIYDGTKVRFNWKCKTIINNDIMVNFKIKTSFDGKNWTEYYVGSINNFQLPIQGEFEHFTAYIYPLFSSTNSQLDCSCSGKRFILNDSNSGNDTGLRLYQTYIIENTNNNGFEGDAGDKIVFTYEAENISKERIESVKISDNTFGSITLDSDPSVLEPGGIISGSYTYIIKQTDVTNGYVQSNSKVIGYYVSGLLVQDVSDAGNDEVETEDANHVTDGDPTNDPTLVDINLNDGDLPDLNCGNASSETTFSNTTPLLNGVEGDIFKINKIPFLVTALTSDSGNGNYSGEGVIRVPFGNKKVSVTFSNIKVNTDKVVYDGTVRAKSDAAGFTVPVNTNSDIIVDCKKPEDKNGDEDDDETVNDDWEDGKYKKPPYDGWKEGDPYDPNYDPNGFDINGNHVITGKPYDENGCTKDGKHYITQEPCESDKGPYYWLGNSGVTIEGSAYAEEKKDSIKPYLILGLNNLLGRTLDTLQIYSASVVGKRDSMRVLLEFLKYPRELVFGIEDEYFKAGMHKMFRETPKPYPVNENRIPEAVLLEKKHIELYHVDKGITNFTLRQLIINSSLTETSLDARVVAITYLIKTKTKDEIEEIKSTGFKKWILNLEEDHIISLWKYDEGYYAYNSVLPIRRKGINFETKIDNYSNIASLDDHFVNENYNISDKLNFEYDQGWSDIDGVNRAFYLREMGRLKQKGVLSGFDSNGGELLPFTVDKESKNKNYSIIFDKLVFYPTDASFDAYLILDEQHEGKQIVFQATGLHFNSGGATDIDTRLKLKSDLSFPISSALGIKLKGSTGNVFIEWDCSGFKKIGVDLEVQVCRKYAIPLDKDNNLLPEPYVVKGDVKGVFESWGEFMADIEIPGFVITGNEDTKFSPTVVKFDFSTTESYGDIIIPDQYFGQNGTGGKLDEKWEGIYIKDLSATLPNNFKKSSGEIIKIGVKDFIIDGFGVTGLVYIQTPIIKFDDKSGIGNWRASIDGFNFVVVKNEVMGAGIFGYIHVPLFKKDEPDKPITEEDCFRYTATLFKGGSFVFDITVPEKGLKIPLWKAQVSLDKSSTIEIKYSTTENDWVNTATLNGTLSIDGQITEKIKMLVPTRKFSNLIIRNKAPYITGGTWDDQNSKDNNESKFSDYPISITEIHGVKTTVEEERGIGFTVNLNLADDAIGGLKASTFITLMGELSTNEGFQMWKFKEIKVDGICIDAKFKGIDTLHGCIVFYDDDPIYGKGFYGEVMIGFSFAKKGGGTKSSYMISAAGMFGNKDGFRYFFVDVLAQFKPGIPMGAVDIVGLGGGVSWNMTSTPFTSLPSNMPENGQQPIPVQIGTSLTNTKYTPAESEFGIKLICVLANPLDDRKFNANLSLEFTFNGNGIKKIKFVGVARFMMDVDFGFIPCYAQGEIPVKKGMSANASFEYDFPSKVFHGSLEVFLYAGSETHVLQGTLTNGKVVDAQIHIEKDLWFIKIGGPSRDPDQRCGLGIFEKNSNVPLFRLQAYFQMGTQIDPLPPLPDNVRNLTGIKNEGTGMQGTGKGIAFGADILFGKPEPYEFLIFYAQLLIELGFDLNLQNYGTTQCANTGEQIGINGWYAMGQAYAYLSGSVGIKVKNKKYEIFDIAGAASIEIRLPNPFWMRGAFGGRYSILCGLVSGQCNFQFEKGERCIPLGYDNSLNQSLISSIYPGVGSEGVPVDVEPFVQFNYPTKGSITITDLNEQKKTYSVAVTSKGIYKNEIGVLVDEYSSDDGTEIKLMPREMLSPETEYTFEIIARLYENGVDTIMEDTIVTFKTGKALDKISEDNIEYSYPMAGQFNFYKNETSDAYIKLHRAQDETLGSKRLFVTINSTDGDSAHSDASYDSQNKLVHYQIDKNKLENNRVYRLDLLSAENGALSRSESQNGSNNADAEVLYTTYFRTSKYNTFLEKINYINTNFSTAYQNADMSLYLNISMNEPFDQVELGRDPKYDQSINANSDIESSNWFRVGDSYNPGLWNMYTCPPTFEVIRSYRPEIDGYSQLFPMNELELEDISSDKSKFISEKEFKENYSIPTSSLYSYKVNYQVLSSIYEDYNNVKNEFNYLNLHGDLEYEHSSEYECARNIMDNFTYPLYTGAIFTVGVKYFRPGGIYSSGGNITLK